MTKILNAILSFLKFALLLGSFAITLYIILFMYKRLDKDLIQSIPVFLPYFLIFVVYTINIILNQKQINRNFFYNLTSCLVFALFIFVGYRAITEQHMLANIRLGYNINFNYYSDMISPLQVMLFGLFIANILLMFTKPKPKKIIMREMPLVVEERL